MNADGGRRLDYDVINMIVQDAHSRSGSQFHVILLGDNNLRDMEPLDSLIGKFTYLVQALSYVPNCNIILVSILPSPKTNQKFLEANFRLKNLANRHFNFCSYLDLERSRFFLNNGDINESLYYDRIHLKDSGSEILAKLIFNHCLSLGTVKMLIRAAALSLIFKSF